MVPVNEPGEYKLNPNAVSLAGEFAVLSQLALRGYDANLTLGNTKHVDILASSPITGNMFKVEVKTHYGNNVIHSSIFGSCLEWVMSAKHESINMPDLYYVFVNIQKGTNLFRFFIVPSQVVAHCVASHHNHWLSVSKSTALNNPIRKFRLGIKPVDCEVEIPQANMYEDQWVFAE